MDPDIQYLPEEDDPPLEPSEEPGMSRLDPEMANQLLHQQSSVNVERLDFAADALNRQYMKLRMSGNLGKIPDKPPAALLQPLSMQGSKTKKKSKKSNEIPLLPPPKQRMYTPGPGAYSPEIDRFAAKSLSKTSYSFGGGTLGLSDRSFLRHHISQQSSPGPMYTPNRETTSTLRSVEKLTFGRDAVNSRSDPMHGEFTNSPSRNPGPGSYHVTVDKKGNRAEAGKNTAAYAFGKGSFHKPEDDLRKISYISPAHEIENLGIHSPGPMYYPDASGTSKFDTIPSYTLRPRGKIMWDDVVDPKNNFQPGPMYLPVQDNRGGKSLDAVPQTFGKEFQRPSPTLNLSGATFITETHAKTVNASVHSPGPIYYPSKPEMHKSSPTLSSGPKDRFYDRFEPNRIH